MQMLPWRVVMDICKRGRCLEGLFDTWGAFGRGFTNDLERGGPTPVGARKANLSEAVMPFAQEIALQEQVVVFL